MVKIGVLTLEIRPFSKNLSISVKIRLFTPFESLKTMNLALFRAKLPLGKTAKTAVFSAPRVRDLAQIR